MYLSVDASGFGFESFLNKEDLEAVMLKYVNKGNWDDLTDEEREAIVFTAFHDIPDKESCAESKGRELQFNNIIQILTNNAAYLLNKRMRTTGTKTIADGKFKIELREEDSSEDNREPVDPNALVSL